MSWNFRVVQFECPEATYYQVCEVYYDGDVPQMYAEATPAFGESITELKSDLDRMQEAFKYPLLYAKDFEIEH